VILADTSAWVEYDRATGSAVHLRMRELVAGEGPLATTEPVVMEVLAGARTDARERDLYALLCRYELRAVEPAADFASAGRIYRQCRSRGVTPRGLVDCLIAAVALRAGDDLLIQDVDLRRVAEVVGVGVDPASG